MGVRVTGLPVAATAAWPRPLREARGEAPGAPAAAAGPAARVVQGEWLGRESVHYAATREFLAGRAGQTAPAPAPYRAAGAYLHQARAAAPAGRMVDYYV